MKEEYRVLAALKGPVGSGKGVVNATHVESYRNSVPVVPRSLSDYINSNGNGILQALQLEFPNGTLISDEGVTPFLRAYAMNQCALAPLLGGLAIADGCLRSTEQADVLIETTRLLGFKLVVINVCACPGVDLAEVSFIAAKNRRRTDDTEARIRQRLEEEMLIDIKVTQHLKEKGVPILNLENVTKYENGAITYMERAAIQDFLQTI